MLQVFGFCFILSIFGRITLVMLEKRTKTPVLMLKKWTFLITLFLSLFLSIRAQTSNYEQTIRSHGFVPGLTHDWSH